MTEQKKSHALMIDSSGDIRILKVLGTEVRVQIPELLQNQELNITDIVRQLGIPQFYADDRIY